MAKVLRPQRKMSPEGEAYGATALRLSREVQERTRVLPDISYGPDEAQALDIYVPDLDPPGPMPVLMFIHGGSWRNGYKEWMGFMAPAITCLPAIFVSVGYRLAPGSRYPLPVEDCRNAVRWVYENISERGGDPNRLFVGGHSAGGHLAALISLQTQMWSDVGLPSDTIKGCFPVSGAYDFSTRDRDADLLRSTEDAVPAIPISHVAGNRVPFYMVVGDDDMPDLMRQAPVMANALKAQPGYVELAEYEGFDHFKISVDCGDADGVWATTVRLWMADPPKADG